jgi:hypothetical protein
MNLLLLHLLQSRESRATQPRLATYRSRRLSSPNAVSCKNSVNCLLRYCLLLSGGRPAGKDGIYTAVGEGAFLLHSGNQPLTFVPVLLQWHLDSCYHLQWELTVQDRPSLVALAWWRRMSRALFFVCESARECGVKTFREIANHTGLEHVSTLRNSILNSHSQQPTYRANAGKKTPLAVKWKLRKGISAPPYIIFAL